MFKMARTKVLICLCFNVSFLTAFLFETSSPKQPTGLLKDDHYDSLLKLFMDEHSARLQLQDVVVAQQQKMQQYEAAMSELHSRLERLEHSPTTDSANACGMCGDLEQKLLTLTMDYNSLKTDFLIEKNSTNQLRGQVESLTHLKAVNQLQTIANMENVTKTLKADVRNLQTISQARAQDLVSLNRIITQNVQNISEVRQEVYSNALSNRQKMEDLNNTITQLSQHAEVEIEVLNSTISHVLDKMKPVGFTAFGGSSAMIQSGTIIKFPVVASSFGLSNISSFALSGQFKAEEAGIYLIISTVTVMTNNDNSWFNIHKNNQTIESMMYYSGRSSTGDLSGTGSIVLHLSVGDLIDVRVGYTLYVDLPLSSLTIVKII